MIPTTLATSSRPEPVTRRPSEETIAFVTSQVVSNASPTPRAAVALVVEPEREPEPVDVVGRVELGVPSSWSADPSRSTVTVTGSPPLPRIASARSGLAARPVHRRDLVAGLQAHRGRGGPGLTSSTTRVAPVGTPSMKTTARAMTAKT